MNNKDSDEMKQPLLQRYYVSAIDTVVDTKTGNRVELLVEHLCWATSADAAEDEALTRWDLNGYNIFNMECETVCVRRGPVPNQLYLQPC